MRPLVVNRLGLLPKARNHVGVTLDGAIFRDAIDGKSLDGGIDFLGMIYTLDT